MTPPLCIGHRGAAGRAPENTIASMLQALEAGADGVELDVHCCKDALIVLHDPTLDRTTNGHGTVSSRCFTDLQTLDAGQGERIPSLREVLDHLPPGLLINIELKGPGTATEVVDCLRQRDELSQRPLLISSFDWKMLATVHDRAPEFDLAPLTQADVRGAIDAAESLGAVALNMAHKHLHLKHVDDVHIRGMKMGAYTVNDPSDIQRMIDLDVDMLISDYPDLVRAALTGDQ